MISRGKAAGSNFCPSDAEKAHIEADNLLCEYLNIVGAKDIVEVFQVITKHYA